ncbi:MAG: Uncharacterized protein XE02_0677 [Mesotoga infera]|uniref:Uncharacterized protein n=1 Tax=Mesotoga infera TaxID=1236046 RepID=A0A101I7W4_9BACT|nr:MAG: Uncharacterized protein XE02_0677 [Mesotoga infera]
MDVSLQLEHDEIYLTGFDMGFNPCFNGCLSSTFNGLKKVEQNQSFNPCFNGCLSSTTKKPSFSTPPSSFNPCFNGCLSSTIYCFCAISINSDVSILVLMDVSLQRVSYVSDGYSNCGFQSLF